MQEPGFEITFPDETEATFVPFTVGMTGSKDLKIIDRCTAMPLYEFAEAFDDPTQRGRGTIMLAMIGLSIRSKYPDWSVERIMAIVDNVDLEDVEFVGGGEAQNGAPLSRQPSESEDSETSDSPSDDSSSPSPQTTSQTKTPSGRSKPTPA